MTPNAREWLTVIAIGIPTALAIYPALWALWAALEWIA